MLRKSVLLFVYSLTAHAQVAVYKCGKTLTANTFFLSGSAGWDMGTAPSIDDGVCSSDRPFFFSSPASEGNYRVTVVLGGNSDSVVTVKAEARRLMARQVHLSARSTKTITFNVHIQTPEFGGHDHVQLSLRERNGLRWDGKLTLEFNGTRPSVRQIAIQAITSNLPVVYLAGDSTVVDQDYEPWTAWGQVLPEFFGPEVVVANFAESGQTLKDFTSQHRIQKIMSALKPGDYLFLQFGHNDQKPRGEPVQQFKEILKEYVAQTRAKGAIPVLVTPMVRRQFDEAGKLIDTLGEYPTAVRSLAAEENVPLIDLNQMSGKLISSLGPETSKRAYMYYEANTYPEQIEAIHDDTHFNEYGAYEMARCIVEGIRELNQPLKRHLRTGFEKFDPEHPDDPASVFVPPTPMFTSGDITKIPQI